MCLLDASTVDVANDTILFKYQGNSEMKDHEGKQFYYSEPIALGPLYKEAHKWVFCPDMQPGEAWLFKQYDTRAGVVPCAFHNSFHDPFHDPDPSCPGRRSCELRILLAFSEGESSERGGDDEGASSRL